MKKMIKGGICLMLAALILCLCSFSSFAAEGIEAYLFGERIASGEKTVRVFAEK